MLPKPNDVALPSKLNHQSLVNAVEGARLVRSISTVTVPVPPKSSKVMVGKPVALIVPEKSAFGVALISVACALTEMNKVAMIARNKWPNQ